MLNNENFLIQKNRISNEYFNLNKSYNGIGTLSEKILHRIIKFFIDDDPLNHEIKIGQYFVDIMSNNTIYEIQTRSFNKLRPKLDFLLSKTDYSVKIVFPIPYEKNICWINKDTKELISKRKSPKTGTIYDSILELYKIKSYLKNENLKFIFLFINLDEYRNLDGWDKTKKKGSTRYERIPNEFISSIEINNKEDFKILIPNNITDTFTNKDFQKEAKTNLRIASTCTNILLSLGLIKQVGKCGRMNLYKIEL